MDIEQNNLEKINIYNDEMTFKDLFLSIKKWILYLITKSKKIFIIGIIGGLVGLSVALLDKPIYKATLTFAMEEDKGNGGGFSSALGLASSFGIDLGGTGGGGAFAASNLAELMKSRLIVEKVLLEPIKINGKETTLANYYIDINHYREIWPKNNNFTNIEFLPNTDRSNFTLQQDSILQLFYKNLIDKDNLTIMQKDKKVTILSIEVKSHDELFSKFFCENLAKETSEFYIETKSKKAKINNDVLQKQVDSVRAELNGAITGVATETDNVYNLNPAFNVKGAPSKKKQIDVQANTAVLTNLVVQLELAKITLRKETPLIQLIDKPILPLEIDKLSKIKSLILGSFFAMVFTILYFIFRRTFKLYE